MCFVAGGGVFGGVGLPGILCFCVRVVGGFSLWVRGCFVLGLVLGLAFVEERVRCTDNSYRG